MDLNKEWMPVVKKLLAHDHLVNFTKSKEEA